MSKTSYSTLAGNVVGADTRDVTLVISARLAVLTYSGRASSAREVTLIAPISCAMTCGNAVGCDARALGCSAVATGAATVLALAGAGVSLT